MPTSDDIVRALLAGNPQPVEGLVSVGPGGQLTPLDFSRSPVPPHVEKTPEDPNADPLAHAGFNLGRRAVEQAGTSPDTEGFVAASPVTGAIAGHVADIVKALYGTVTKVPRAVAEGTPLSKEEVDQNAFDIAARMAMPSPFSRPAPGVLNIFAGPRALTADREALAEAQRMLLAGEPRESIIERTKWLQDPFNNWMYEIPDDAAKVTRGTDQMLSHASRLSGGRSEVSGQLGPFYSHPEAYAAYPSLKTIRTTVGYDAPHHGVYTPENYNFKGSPQTIEAFGRLGETDPTKSLPGILAHEVQHAVSAQEGWPRGSTPQEFRLAPDVLASLQRQFSIVNDAKLIRSAMDDGKTFDEALDVVEKMAAARGRFVSPKTYDLVAADRGQLEDTYNRVSSQLFNAGQGGRAGYHRVRDEVQARNVQARLNMSPTERYLVKPWETEDVAPELQHALKPWPVPSASVASDAFFNRRPWKNISEDILNKQGWNRYKDLEGMSYYNHPSFPDHILYISPEYGKGGGSAGWKHYDFGPDNPIIKRIGQGNDFKSLREHLRQEFGQDVPEPIHWSRKLSDSFSGGVKPK